MARLNKDGDPNFQQVKDFPLNPKALSLGELYGEFDLNTNEWTDGVLSSVMRQTCAGQYFSWIFDGLKMFSFTVVLALRHPYDTYM